MGLLAGELLRVDLPRADKRLLVLAETAGCAVDGIIAATGCHVGGRTLRILDFGKVAATFVDTHIEEAIRIAVPRPKEDYHPLWQENQISNKMDNWRWSCNSRDDQLERSQKLR